jgi:FkbM family methyltransferase
MRTDDDRDAHGSRTGTRCVSPRPRAPSQVYALEPDFRAFSELYWNVHANPAFEDKVTVKSLCISDKPGTLTMHGQPGSSMSAIGTVEESDKAKKVKGRTEWTVECTTLDAFVESQGIDPSKLVLKIDTEGAEKDILRQLRPWIAKYQPAMLLSMVRAAAAGGGRGEGAAAAATRCTPGGRSSSSQQTPPPLPAAPAPAARVCVPDGRGSAQGAAGDHHELQDGEGLRPAAAPLPAMRAVDR